FIVCLLFFSLLRLFLLVQSPSPRSTLFPYTTLFRSLAAGFDSNHDGVIDARDARFGELMVWQDANQNGRTDPGELTSLTDLGITDRKSTRLNSSHGSISYAVFCLKKKKIPKSII